MTITREHKYGETVLKIKGPLSVYEVAELRDQFLECLETYDGLRLDLSEVDECDTAGVQLLYSARITVRDTGKSFDISNPSPSVINAMTLVGLKPEDIL
ncbi:STAS domain-containing protein [Desulfonema magnum]|uniref:STAS domain-containing protein n=1 Tax=Desulfonema magnum TaxID=45655 RepID=A0A975BS39_9BACT|nr:STAS domain-containing protein [Desulfonema magnum]QTA90661.1 STAS domain-containing protein [Desulfonema magnum]